MSRNRLFVLVAPFALFAFIALPATAQMALPSNVAPTCTVSSSTFASWFAGGSPTTNGAVKPADSVNFPTTNTVCDFFTWGAQMFLWLTSPTSSGLVLDSPAIFNVLPANSAGVRYLQPNNGTTPTALALRSEKFDDIGEVGQAGGGGVLMSQQKSLVFYGVHVNDVYGYFLTGQKNGALSETVFPRNSQDLGNVINYTRNVFPGTTLVAPNTLVMELKTSWVEASSLPDSSTFVTMEATIPTYSSNKSNTTWTPSGTTTTKLALVGLHIMGTVQNHPEFVWITYEHITNAPDANYYYLDSSNNVVEQTYDSSGKFVFMATGGSLSSANVECMKVSGSNIVANPTSTTDPTPKCSGGIVKSNTARTYPWGSQAGSQTSAVVTNNTLLLSINNSILGQLSRGDLRANYVQTGGIWTSAPSTTADAPIPNTTSFKPSDLRGSLQAFNATMETYKQGTSCFSCHAQSATAPNSFQPFQLSHIYSQIAPIPTGGQ